jgi:hypothetical protein
VSLSPYDVAVSELTARGFARDRAEAAVRRQLPQLAPVPDPAATRRDLILEKAEQAEILKRFRACRFKAYTLSQPRASKQTPGLPDVYLMHLERPLALWWESKRQIGGAFSEAQLEFAAGCDRCAVLRGAGDRYAAEAWLVAHRLADVINDTFYPVIA